MKKKTKISFLIILMIVIASVLVGCNGKNNTDATPTTPQATESGLPNLGKFVAVVPKSSDADYSIGNEAVKQKIIESIANEKGVIIDIEVIELSETDFTNELNQLLSSSTYIDCIVADYDMLSTYAGLPGLIKPIDSLINSHGTNLYNAIDVSYWEEVKYDGQIYGVPSVPYPEESIMMARSDMLYMFTTEPITTYSSLLALCKFYKTVGYEYPLAVTWDQLIDILAISFNVSAAPYTHYSKSNAFIMREQSANYIKRYLEEIKLLYDNGYIHPDIFTASADQMKAEFMAGRAAVYVAEYSDVYSDRQMLTSTFPDAEMKLIEPLITRYNKQSYLSCEDKVDNVLMFTGNGQNSEALMTYLDWAYTTQLNHTMAELGAFGQQILYNPAVNEYEYLGDYTQENKPYDGLYTLGLSTDLLYTPPTHVEYAYIIDIMAKNTLQKDVQTYLRETQHKFYVTVELNDTAKTALDQYTNLMRTGAAQYIKGEIDIDGYMQYERDSRNSGLLATLSQEIGVAYLYKIGVLE